MSPFAAMRRLRRDSLTPGLRGALVAGIALHIAGIALIGATWRMPAPPADPAPFVRLSSSTMSERAELLDPSPLFLPTPLNHRATRVGAGAVFDAGRVAGDPDDPPLDTPRANKPDPAVAPARREPVYGPLTAAYAARGPLEATPARTADLFLPMGRKAPDVSALPPSVPRYILRDEVTGRVVASGPLAVRSLARTFKTAVPRPAEFFVEVDDYGVSTPVPRALPRLVPGGDEGPGTGDAAADARLLEAVVSALAKNPPPPGRFRLVATP